ncbi:hypothetical protein UUU_32330 [Klebsiella pneumoniae subsp. pneumoniae DSM 30104 = JCM 1662 = NBRC 14940]|nr:hypothetical protein UUU_32330 [Klebsiella pneumoniae subsp. pneumoniae DSM 30104 = JCM 1662 = NBRC 14940]
MMAPVFIMLPPRGRLKASLSVAFKGGLFLHKMQVLLLHLNPRRDRGFLSPPGPHIKCNNYSCT